MKSDSFKIITIIIAILGGISSISVWVQFKMIAGICCLISTIIICLIFYGISSILAYLEELGAGKKEDNNVIQHVTIKQVETRPKKGDWMCPKCHTVNTKNDNSCNCGYQKVNADFWKCPVCHLEMPNSLGNECAFCHLRK